MSATTSSIFRELTVQNHNVWLKINAFFARMFNIYGQKKVTAVSNSKLIDESKSNRFIQAVKRVELKYGFEPIFSEEAPYGHFRGRHIIGENTKVTNGIFVSAIPGEAIVVDEKYGVLQEIYNKLVSRVGIVDNSSPNYEYLIFSKVISLTRETLRYSEESVENITKQYRIDFDEKVSLDLYIKKKVGVARHQVLLAAYLLEKLKEKYLIKGAFWIDQTFSTDAYQERLVFKSADGEVFRFDPTKGLGKTAIH